MPKDKTIVREEFKLHGHKKHIRIKDKISPALKDILVRQAEGMNERYGKKPEDEITR